MSHLISPLPMPASCLGMRHRDVRSHRGDCAYLEALRYSIAQRRLPQQDGSATPTGTGAQQQARDSIRTLQPHARCGNLPGVGSWLEAEMQLTDGGGYGTTSHTQQGHLTDRRYANILIPSGTHDTGGFGV